MLWCGTAYANSALDELRKFAEQYEPLPEQGAAIPHLPSAPPNIVAGLNELSSNKHSLHEKYIVLIALKLYRFHFENFHQSYDLRGPERWPDNPFLKELCRLWALDCMNKEFIPSSMAYFKSRDNNQFNYPEIAVELNRIKKALKDIKSK